MPNQYEKHKNKKYPGTLIVDMTVTDVTVIIKNSSETLFRKSNYHIETIQMICVC